MYSTVPLYVNLYLHKYRYTVLAVSKGSHDVVSAMCHSQLTQKDPLFFKENVYLEHRTFHYGEQKKLF
jgi:hypothetical protein